MRDIQDGTGQVTKERRDWPREPRVLSVKIHTEHANWRAMAVDLSRSGVQLALVDPRFNFTQKEGDLGLVGLRVASQFGDSFRVEFMAAEIEVESEMVRISERTEGDEYIVYVGCRFLRDLEEGECKTLDVPAEQPEPREPEPLAPVDTVQVPGGAAIVVPGDAPKRRASALVKARSVKIASGGGEMSVHDLMRLTLDHRATDLHIKAGSPVRLRVDGNLRDVGDKRLSAEDVRGLTRAILDADQYDRFDDEGDLDMACSLPGAGRFRVNVLRTQGDIGMAIRRIPEEVPSIHELGVAPVCLELAERPRGLVLVTGPTGSGKSTTLAAIIDLINESRAPATSSPSRTPSSTCTTRQEVASSISASSGVDTLRTSTSALKHVDP